MKACSAGSSNIGEFNQAYWQGRFSTGDTPWELGRESSVVCEALSELETYRVEPGSSTALSPGCGTGSDALELARRGFHVLAVDWTDLAVSETSRRFESIRSAVSGSLRVRQGDFFSLQPEPVELVCEHTFFCAIDPSLRRRYIETVAAWLKPGGFLAGNFFIVSAQEAKILPALSLTKQGVGPPFASTRDELNELTRDYFECLVMRPAQTPEPTRRPGLEWVCIFKKR